MINPTLSALRNLGGSANNDAIRREVAKIMELSEAQIQATFTRNGIEIRRIDNRLDWVKVYLGTTDIIERLDDGDWSLTGQGKRNHVVDAQDIISRARAIYQR